MITIAYIIFILLTKRLITYVVNANLPFRLEISFSSMCVKTIKINLRIPNLGKRLNLRIPVPILLAMLSWLVKLSILPYR